MLNKFIRWYLSYDALPYWYLLIADCVLILLAGIAAFYANHSLEGVSVLPVLLTLMAYLPAYLVGFRVFRTYLAPARRVMPKDVLRISGALLLGFAIIMFLRINFHTDSIGQTIRSRDLLLQCLLSMVLMICLRIMVRINFEGYVKRNHLTGLYGLSNSNLLDIELSSLLTTQRDRGGHGRYPHQDARKAHSGHRRCRKYRQRTRSSISTILS